MKIQRHMRRLLFAVTVLLSAAHTAAQTIPFSGVWNNIENVLQSQTVYLTGDIKVNGNIRIGDGSTTVEVTLVNNTGKPITISNNVSNGELAAIFMLRKGCKLTVRGQEGSEIIFDGGADFTWDGRGDEWTLTGGSSSKRFQYSMFETNGDLTLEHVIIRNYYTVTDEQAAIKVAAQNETCGKTTLKNCLIENCKAPFGPAIYGHSSQNRDDNTPESCAITLDNTVIQHCVCTLSRNSNGGINDNWGGAIRFRGGCRNNLTMINCTMQENYSQGDGGAIWWNAGGNKQDIPVLTMNGCKFINNRAHRDAGALRLEGSFTFEGNETVMYDNSCGRHGAAIQIAGYNGGSGQFASRECNYYLPELLNVYDNTAGENGGGISFYFTSNDLDEGTIFNIYLNGLNVHDNRAGTNGGGLSFEETTNANKKYVFNVYLDAGTVKGNVAGSGGGGIYVDDLIIGKHDNAGTIYIEENEAKDGGGGGIYLKGGSITVNNANITGNKIVSISNNFGNGGGIRVENGSFSMSSGAISENEAHILGGGNFVYNDKPEPKSVSIGGGDISKNKARLAGGGICIYGNVNFNMSGVDVEYNTAYNGGGVFMQGLENAGATMKFSSGLIRNNQALQKTGVLETAYGMEVQELEGMGGGIYVGSYATLNFDITDGLFGIYSNLAANGADDIFSSGKSSSVTIPNVSNMNLADNAEASGHNLFWVEDYIADDPNYDQGTKIKGDEWESDKTNQRYRAVKSGAISGKYYEVPSGTYTNYLSLTLGWSEGFITLVKEGMQTRDNAIFKIYQGDSSSNDEYMTVILTNNDADENGVRKKRIKLEDKTWTVRETPWSWAYKSDMQYITRTLKVSSSPEERTFTFKNTADSDTPLHSESVKVNEMTPQVQQ